MAKYKRSSKKRITLWGVAILLIVVIVVLLLELTNTTHFFHSSKSAAISAGQSTKGEPSSNQQSSNSGTTNGSNQPGNSSGARKATGNNGTPATYLLQPTGDFVSNHYPGKNGTPATETSVCNTTPGAKCKITFRKGSVVKNLPSQTTDEGGATYWNNWTPSSIGLTSGSWQIQAIASSNGQTKTATDAMDLVVQ